MAKNLRELSPILHRQNIKKEKKGSLVLDLDGTLICSIEPDEMPHKNDVRVRVLNMKPMEDMYHVFHRPYLEEFLDYIFDNFRVGVWTAASHAYAAWIVNFIINPPNKRKLGRCIEFIFYDVHTKMSEKIYGGHKDLRLLWEKFKIEGFNADNTVILDDLDRVWKSQPCHAIRAHEFDFREPQSHRDKILLVIQSQLETMLEHLPHKCPAKLATAHMHANDDDDASVVENFDDIDEDDKSASPKKTPSKTPPKKTPPKTPKKKKTPKRKSKK